MASGSGSLKVAGFVDLVGQAHRRKVVSVVLEEIQLRVQGRAVVGSTAHRRRGGQSALSRRPYRPAPSLMPLTSYRYSQNDRWHRHREDPDGPADVVARDVSFVRRASAKSALFRLQLVTADPALNHLATQALDAPWRICSSADQPELNAGRDQALIALQEFMNAASQQVLDAAARGQAQRASLYLSP
ncbi:hypothetical protein HTZ77_44070 [Nonomuraea sp. SMC257]|uniref:Uncharacterized protein n=1 Tax=Nonomuraea montanisoli TaxID=2741721 RepID=A0A7Y6M7S0_9ACTN|nr:hypothetical protein [Nonomuraea montanisoli]NUW38328.1 hypothetical protein [Nonomuraea montanisoli]